VRICDTESTFSTTVSKDDLPIQKHIYPRNRKALGISLLTLIWFGAVSFGSLWMWKYESTPGDPSTTPIHWPSNSRIQRSIHLPTLIVFAHPRCPCTRASIRELSLLMTHCAGRLDARVLFFKPASSSANWERTDLWRSAEAIPGVQVEWDEGGEEANYFLATTSGYSSLYNQSGQLMFSGGITGSRGHSGDNSGRSAIESVLINGRAGQQRAPVFGCSLLGSAAARDTESIE